LILMLICDLLWEENTVSSLKYIAEVALKNMA
jgi:hypothetical protein